MTGEGPSVFGSMRICLRPSLPLLIAITALYSFINRLTLLECTDLDATSCDDHGTDAACGVRDDQSGKHEYAKYTAAANERLVDSESSTKWSKFFKAREEALRANKSAGCSNNHAKCGCFLEQIDADLLPWQEKRISRDLLTAARELGVTYQVINHQLYRQAECHFPARCEGIEYFLLQIAPELDDTEFVVNVRDWAQVINDPRRYHLSGSPLPVFSFSKEPEWYSDILYPAWSFWAGGPAIGPYPRGIGDWGALRATIAQRSEPWHEKQSIAFFRGSRTSPDRDPLVLLSRAKPDLLDAQVGRK